MSSTTTAPITVSTRAARLIEEYGYAVPGVQELQAMGTLVALLRMLDEAEHNVGEAYQTVLELSAVGALSRRDVDNYEALRINLLGAQTSLYVELDRRLRAAGLGAAADRLPRPEAAPAAPSPGKAVPAALASPWVWAGAILALLVVIGIAAFVAYTVAESAEALAKVFVVREQSVQYRELLARRRQAYQDCIDSGGDTADCAAAARMQAPTPANALPELPSSSPSYTWLWVTLGLVFVAGVGVTLWLSNRGSPQRGGRRGGAGIDRAAMYPPRFEGVTYGARRLR
jgi:hypothetical protein